MPQRAPHLTLLVCSMAALLSAQAVHAAPINQKMPGPNGEQQQGSLNHLGMSRSGRFVLMPDSVNAFPGSTSSPMYVRDIAKQTTSILSVDGASGSFYAISPNGRYVSLWSPSRGGRVVLDRQRGLLSTTLPAAVAGDHNVGLSDNGYALYKSTAPGSTQPLILFHLDSATQQTLEADGGTLGSLYQRNPLSADGRMALYTAANGSKRIYSADLGASYTFSPQWSGQALIVADATLASSGRFLAFGSSTSGHGNYLYRATLTPNGQHTLTRYDLTPLKVSLSAQPLGQGLSISANGRFITFHGALEAGHPEFAAAQAVGSPGYTRILRYDTRLNQVVTMTTSHTGGAIQGTFGTPLVNTTSIVSDDGTMVEFATNAQNITATPPMTQGGEQNYHAYVSNGFARNFEFVDLPSTRNNYSDFGPMTLVGDHQWVGYVEASAASDAFRIVGRGKLVNGSYDSSETWHGSSSTLGQAQANGGLISPSQFSPQYPGTWRITFNDQTLKYTYSKADWKRTVIFIQGVTSPGQDMFIRGGIDHAQGTARGLNCNDSNYLCSLPIRYRNTLNNYTRNWKVADFHLDWYGAETGQTLVNGVNAGAGLAQGSVMDWTTNNSANANNVAANGLGYTPLNSWGDHYWMLDVDIDCGQTVNGWFEVKSFISNGPGWEPDISQVGAPYASGNHFAQCGKLNRFQRGNNSVIINNLP